jgi:hypothetical protein
MEVMRQQYENVEVLNLRGFKNEILFLPLSLSSSPPCLFHDFIPALCGLRNSEDRHRRHQPWPCLVRKAELELAFPFPPFTEEKTNVALIESISWRPLSTNFSAISLPSLFFCGQGNCDRNPSISC